MKKLSVILLLAVLNIACNMLTLREGEEFRARSADQVQKDLEEFTGSHNWQYNGTEKRPLIAATPEELKRLKTAWGKTGTEHNVIAGRIARADNALAAALIFPPEGGQHNQWYQCADCQIVLSIVDAHHHKCSECDKIYSGFPYDNVLYSRQHSRNCSFAEDAAWAWTVTGDVKYAEFTASVLLGYAERYLKYPMVHAQVNDKSIDVASEKNGKYSSAGHIAEQTLNEAGLMIPIVTAYDLIFKSGVLSSDDRKKIENDLIRAMADCINVHKTGKSNWQTWHNAALLYAGVMLGDKEMVKQSFLDKENGFLTQMQISVMPEGMWYENSWAYHYYTLSALTIMAEGARRLGIDIYSHETMHKMYLLAFKYLMADGSLPRFGDAVNDSPNNSVNEKAYAVYKDRRLLATLPTEATWDMILSGRKAVKKAESLQPVSNLIPGTGHAILATGGPGRLTAALTFGPYGGFHGHFDKLSFVFFGYGEELGVDPGRAASQAYRLPVHSEWYKATTGHNAVLVDGIPQKEAEGELLAYAAEDSYAAIAAGAGPAFDNVTHNRFLLLGPTYLLVVDKLKSTDGKEHTYDWLYHNKGRSADCDMPASEAGLGELPPGYSYLKDVKAFRVEGANPFSIKFINDKVATHLTMLGNPSDIVFTASGPFSSVVDRAPMMIARRTGSSVDFISVLEPVPAGQMPDIRSIEVIPGNSLSVKITRNESEDIISFDNEDPDGFIVTNKTPSGETTVLRSESVIK